MKNLTILFCLFLAFAFADWDVDPDFSEDITIDGDLTVSGETNLGNAPTDTVTVLGAMKLTTAVIDSAEENGAQDTLFIYVGGGRVYCLPLAPNGK